MPLGSMGPEPRTGEKLSKATVHATLREVKAFFQWLAQEPGYRSHIAFADADYLSPTDKDVAIARARRPRPYPSLQQVEAVLAAMPAATAIERRDRALVAFTALTGARVAALCTFQLRHVNIEQGYVEQDARTVKTKFAKSFRTYFMPVSDTALEIVREWVRELREDHLRGEGEALFPSTLSAVSESGEFEPVGLARTGWTETQPVRTIFRAAFAAAELPYFNPHSFRSMLVHHAMRLNLGPEAIKAWSQNLGHGDVMTTFTSYGSVPVQRQGDLIRSSRNDETGMNDAQFMAELAKRLGKGG